jgi:hypothetical protein
MKLIYIVRHPLEKLESTYIQWRSTSSTRAEKVGKAFGIAGPGTELLKTSFSDSLMETEGLAGSANYWREIQVHRELFDDRQILVLFFEDFKNDLETALKRCFEFLGVDPVAKLSGSESHLNRATDKTIPRPGFSRLRTMPLIRTAYRGIVPLFSERMRERVSERFFRVPVKGRPQWEPEVRREIIGRLKPDTERFLEHYGKSTDFWLLEG